MSAIVFRGPPGRLIEFVADGHLQLVLSPPLIEELREVLRRKFDFSDAAAYQTEALVRRISLEVEPQREVAIISEDPEDNRVLETAIAGNAEIIISGEHHLLDLETFGPIPIMSPRELLKKIVSARSCRDTASPETGSIVIILNHWSLAKLADSFQTWGRERATRRGLQLISNFLPASSSNETKVGDMAKELMRLSSTSSLGLERHGQLDPDTARGNQDVGAAVDDG